MDEQEMINVMTIRFLEGVGDVNGRKLIAYFGNAGEVIRQNKRELGEVPGIGRWILSKLDFSKARSLAEKEMEYAHRNGVQPICLGHSEYPEKLLHCHDAPLVLFKMGNFSWEWEKSLSIVGTRMMTRHGGDFIKEFMQGAKAFDPVIVSGLAYGVDICAHERALAEGLRTVGVLAHGLDRIYPALHRATAERMLENGGLLTEFPSGIRPEKENFVRRNRIIAGLAEATLVVESGTKGGSLITADLALSYHREVFAVPGRFNDLWSQGCNQMIRENKAGLITCFNDLEQALNWTTSNKVPAQRKLFMELDPKEQLLFNHLCEQGETDQDQLCVEHDLSMPETASILLGLEIKGLVRRTPGNRFKTY